jgi:hypothetical protein
MNTHFSHQVEKTKSNKMGKLYRIHVEAKNLCINSAGKHEEERPLGIRKSK